MHRPLHSDTLRDVPKWVLSRVWKGRSQAGARTVREMKNCKVWVSVSELSAGWVRGSQAPPVPECGCRGPAFSTTAFKGRLPSPRETPELRVTRTPLGRRRDPPCTLFRKGAKKGRSGISGAGWDTVTAPGCGAFQGPRVVLGTRPQDRALLGFGGRLVPRFAWIRSVPGAGVTSPLSYGERQRESVDTE